MRDGDRVAIVLLSAIGDIVHAFPLVSSLKAAYPESRIEWFAHPVPGQVARRHPGVDQIWTLDRRSRWRALRVLRRSLTGERFDLLIDLQVYAKASLVTALVESPRKIGFDRRRARELNWLVTNERLAARPIQHVREEYLEFADHLEAPRRYEWPFTFSEMERGDGDRFREGREAPLAALVVGTSRPEKEWPPESWAEVALALRQEWGYDVALVGGRSPREDALARKLVEAGRAPVEDLRANDIGRLGWLLDSAALLVGCDTGPYHLGVALGVPAVGLFGVTDPARFGPPTGCLDHIVDAFHDPGEDWTPARRRRRPGRMARIAPRDVLEAVELARSRHPRARGAVPATDPVSRTFPL